jgi:hypothetical protein
VLAVLVQRMLAEAEVVVLAALLVEITVYLSHQMAVYMGVVCKRFPHQALFQAVAQYELFGQVLQE